MSTILAPQTLKHAAFDLKVKATEETDDLGTFEGIASAVGVLDFHGDVIERGAYDATLKAKGPTFVLLWQHDVTKPIGVIHLSVDAKGDLVGRGEINLKTTLGREAYELLKQGAIGAMSIGFNIPEGGAVRDSQHGILRILQIDLWETSLVTFPANPGAQVSDVKAALREIVERAKAGKVLSAANKAKVTTAIEALDAARDALQALLDAAEAGEEKSGDEPENTSTTGDEEAIGHPNESPELDAMKQLSEELRTFLNERTGTT